MRIFITGSSGFIGKNLLNKLINSNHEILISYNKTNIKFPNCNVVKYNIGDRINSKINSFEPEILIHLAWENIPDFSYSQSIINMEKNILFLNAISEIKSLNKIIVTGSCLEYGSFNGKCKENFISKPNSYFSFAKKSIYNFLEILCVEKKIDYVWFRVFYVYGMFQRKDSIIPNIFNKLLYKNDLRIKYPYNKNDYVYVDDVVDAIILSIKKSKINSILNIGSGKITSVLSLVKKIENKLSINKDFSNYLMTKSQKSNLLYKKADILLSKKILNWSPKFTIDQGIDHLIKNYYSK